MGDLHLILSTPRDLHAVAVRQALEQAGHSVRMHSFLASRELARSSLAFEDGRLELSLAAGLPGSLRAIWNRRPRWDALPYPVAEDDADFVRQQWRQFIDNVHLLAPRHSPVFWINHHRAALAAEAKGLQLRTAAQAGLNVPRTLISNDPERIRAFLASGERFVFKSFTPYTWIHADDGRREAAMTQPIDRHARFDDASVLAAPGIYQAYIDKRYELRVTVIGTQLFAMRVRSNLRSGIDDVDWRAAVHDPQAQVQACRLPYALERKLLRLVRALGLVQGSIDLAVDALGEAHFLEINQGGQFLYVEERLPELPLLAAFCSLFAQARRDFVLDRSFGSYAGFCASEAYRQWQREQDAPLPDRTPMVRVVGAPA